MKSKDQIQGEISIRMAQNGKNTKETNRKKHDNEVKILYKVFPFNKMKRTENKKEKEKPM